MFALRYGSIFPIQVWKCLLWNFPLMFISAKTMFIEEPGLFSHMNESAMKRADKIHAVSQKTLNEIIKMFPKLENKVFSTLPHKQIVKENLDFQIDNPDKLGAYGLFVGTFSRCNLAFCDKTLCL